MQACFDKKGIVVYYVVGDKTDEQFYILGQILEIILLQFRGMILIEFRCSVIDSKITSSKH